MENSSVQDVDRRLVVWAHDWAVAASETYKSIESISMPESPFIEIERRDAMTMVLVGAVRNVVRGAELAVGKDSEIVRRFNEGHPDLKDLRDRFEHYEDYVTGAGRLQRKGRNWGGEPLRFDGEGIRISASSGGGPNGHQVRVIVLERGENDEAKESAYEVPSRAIAVAVRCLVRELANVAGMLDEHHLGRCEICAAPEGI